MKNAGKAASAALSGKSLFLFNNWTKLEYQTHARTHRLEIQFKVVNLIRRGSKYSEGQSYFEVAVCGYLYISGRQALKKREESCRFAKAQNLCVIMA